MDLVSGLDLGHGGHVSINDTHTSLCGHFPYTLQEALAGTIAVPTEGSDSGNAGPVSYPSPASTISAGCSHTNSSLDKLADAAAQSLPISGSSELAHALQPTHEQVCFKPGSIHLMLT